MSSRRLVLLAPCVAICFSSPLAAQQPAPPNDGFQSGGLAPPTGMGGPQQTQPGFQTETERRLDESEKEDAGRGLDWVYFDVEGGYEFAGLETLKGDGLTYGDVGASGGGLMLGGGAGIRLIYLTFGARARVGMFEHWKLGTINGEMGVHIPLGMVEPYFTFGAGYAFLGSLDADTWGGDTTIRGWDLRAGFGLDYYVTPAFSVGGKLTGDVLFLSRKGVSVDPASTLDASAKETAAADGSGIGAAFTGSAVLGLHF